MTPTNDAPVTVEQCDREAAADHLAALGQINAQFRIRTGIADEHSLVQTLARHRLAALASAPAKVEPFGYWIEQKHAEPALLRKPAYIPEPSDLRTVTPLYTAPVFAAVGVEPFDDWINRLRTEVVQGEYGYEEGEFSVDPDDWRQMWREGLTASEAFVRALEAHSSVNTASAPVGDAFAGAGKPIAPAGPLPDIGPDPFKGPREDDRYEGSRLRLRAAYVQQQKGVPDQTALVWRYDLGTVLEMAIRLKSILADDDEAASAPAGGGYGKWHPMLLDIVNAIHGDRGEKTQVIGIDQSYQQALAAALDRPRAAVGEREASPSIGELARLIDKRAMLFGDDKGYRSRRFNALAKARTIADRFAATDQQVEMMVVLERVAMLLHTHWLTTTDEKAFRALADEITPLLEGVGMTPVEGGYGFDWDSEQEATARRLGGDKAIIHRLALQSPPAKVEAE